MSGFSQRIFEGESRDKPFLAMVRPTVRRRYFIAICSFENDEFISFHKSRPGFMCSDYVKYVKYM